MARRQDRQDRRALPRARRVLGAIVLLALAPYAIYMVVANAALNTGLLARAVNGAQHDLVLSIDSGWTVWPARLHARGLTLRFEDANVQFSLTADEIATSIDLPAGLRKEFHAFWVRGTGVSYWFRHKLDVIKGNEFRIAGFPVIPGYDPVPLRVPWPTSTTATEDLWIVHLDDVQAEVRDFWMMEFRFLGEARASGSFELAPRRHLWLKDARLELERGKLDRGEVDSIASRFSGKIHAEYLERNPDEVSMEQNLAWTHWLVDVRADVDKVDVLAGYLERGVHVRGGRGPLRISLETRDQRIVNGSRATYSSERLTVRSSAMRAELRGAVAFHKKAGSTRIDVDVPHAVLDTKGAKSRFVVDGARGFVTFDHARLDRPWHAQAIDARVRSARTGDDGLRLPGGLRLDGMVRAKVVGRADAEGRLAGQAFVHVVPMRMRMGEHSASGKGEADARFRTRRAWLEGGTLFDVSAQATHVTARSGDDQVKGWWLVAASPVVEYEGMPPQTLRAKVSLSAQNGRPLVAALEEEGEIPGVVGTLWTLDNLKAQGLVRMTPRSLDIDVERVSSDSLGGKGRYRRVAGRERAVFLVETGPFGMGFELGDKGLSTSPLSGETWFRSLTRAVFGTAKSDPCSARAKNRGASPGALRSDPCAPGPVSRAESRSEPVVAVLPQAARSRRSPAR